jgi:hypothetical protein
MERRSRGSLRLNERPARVRADQRSAVAANDVPDAGDTDSPGYVEDLLLGLQVLEPADPVLGHRALLKGQLTPLGVGLVEQRDRFEASCCMRLCVYC